MEQAAGALGKEAAGVPSLGLEPGSLEGRSGGCALSREQNSEVAWLAEAQEAASTPPGEDPAQSWSGGSAGVEGQH